MLQLKNLILAGLALFAIALAGWKLVDTTSGLDVTRAAVGQTPITIFRKPENASAPVVVIAHGFAGSQQLMQPFAVTLANNGYIAVTFDFLGHGRHPLPLGGSIIEVDGATLALVDQLSAVTTFARTLVSPDPNGKVPELAVLGHSMASDIVVRHAQANLDVKATVAISMFSPVVTPDTPRNLLVVVGDLEPEALKAEARRVVAMVSSSDPKPQTTYGDFADGSARRYALASGVEHVSVLYSQDALREAVQWLDQTFERTTNANAENIFVDTRGPWLALLFTGLIVLAKPLAMVLPRAANAPIGSGLPWRQLLPVVIGPTLLTPLLLWKMPTDFLPILVGDYLAVHFAVYGVLTAIGLWWVRRKSTGSETTAKTNVVALFMATAAVAAYSIVVIGLPLDEYVTSFVPVAQRQTLVISMLLGMLPFFIADEWLTRGAHAPKGAYAVTKLMFLVSLAIAVALNLEKLFFLIIIVPVIVIFFIVYGLFSAWAYRQTHHPLVGALANALSFAWALAVTFPVLAR